MSMGSSLTCEKFVSPVYRRPNRVGGVWGGSCALFDQPNSSFSLSGKIILVWFCRIFTRTAFYLDFSSWMKEAPLGRQRRCWRGSRRISSPSHFGQHFIFYFLSSEDLHLLCFCWVHILINIKQADLPPTRKTQAISHINREHWSSGAGARAPPWGSLTWHRSGWREGRRRDTRRASSQPVVMCVIRKL